MNSASKMTGMEADDGLPRRLAAAMSEAWARVAADRRLGTAFAKLENRSVPEMRWPSRLGRTSSVVTGFLRSNALQMRDFTIREIGEVERDGPPILDNDSLRSRFPILISNVTVSTNVTVKRFWHQHQTTSDAQFLITFAPVHCEVLGKIGVDGITGRPFTVVYGFNFTATKISVAELANPSGTVQIDKLDLILSDSEVHGGMESAIQLVMCDSPAIDDFQVWINRALAQSWPDSKREQDALSLAGDSRSPLSVLGMERIARHYGLDTRYGRVGVPEIQPALPGWNAYLKQRFAMAEPDGTTRRKDIEVAFRVGRNGQVFTLVIA